jgi:hypothetical protein
MDKKDDIEQFEKLEQQLHSFLTEVSELSRKKSNDALNKFKLKFINSTLDGLNKLLGDLTPFDDFKQFDVDELPTNSDVVVILGQYAAAAYNFRRRNTVEVSYNKWYWAVRGKASDLQTKSPDDAKYGAK